MIFQCPKCGTPISSADNGECSCGTRIPSYVVRQIQAMRELPQQQLELGLQRFDELDLRLPLRLDPG